MLTRGLGRFAVLLAGLTLAALLAFAACGDEEEEAAETPPAAASPEEEALYLCTPPETGAAVADVPELSDGVLQVGSDIAYAPIESFDENNNEVGVDIDLGNCLAEELGVAVEYLNLGFDPLIPSIQGGEIDVIMSAMTINPEREQQIDFIPYFTARTGILVPQGNPNGIQSIEDLCGLIVAVQVGTIQVDQLDALNAGACAANNVTIQTFDENPLAVEQLRAGAADANLADHPTVINDALLSEGDLELAGEPFEAAPYGIGIRKDSTALNQALTDALVAIIEDGRYDDILAKWGVEGGAFKEVAQ